MNNYLRYIQGLAKENSTESFVNSGPQHAAIVMSTIFKNAKNYIYLFSGNLNGDISNNEEYQKQLSGFLIRGGELKILLQKHSESSEPKIFNLFRFFSNVGSKISIKKHPYQIVDNNANKEVHFVVADDKMYRLENDTEKYLAVGSFNDISQSLSLKETFLDIYGDEKSTPISLS